MSRPERASIGDEVVLARGRGKRVALNGQPATVRAYKHGWARVSLSGGQRELPWRSGHWSARAGVSAAAERVGLLSLDRELIGAILGQVRQRKDVVRAAGSCRALRAVARGHSCWHSVEFVEQGSLGEMMAMCALRVPLHRVNLTFGAHETPLVPHFLETCDTRKLERLTLRRVEGFHFALSHEPQIDLSGPGVAFIASIEGRCEGAALRRSVRDAEPGWPHQARASSISSSRPRRTCAPSPAPTWRWPTLSASLRSSCSSRPTSARLEGNPTGGLPPWFHFSSAWMACSR